MSADNHATEGAVNRHPRWRTAILFIVAACLVELFTAWALRAHGVELLSIRAATRQPLFWVFVAGAMSLPVVLILCVGRLFDRLAADPVAEGPCPVCTYPLPAAAQRCSECGAHDVLERRRRHAVRSIRAFVRVAVGATLVAVALVVVKLWGKALAEGSDGRPMIYLMLLITMALALNGTVAVVALGRGVARDGGVVRFVVRIGVALLATYLGVAAALNALYVVRGPIGVVGGWPWWLSTPPGSGTARWGWLWSLGAAVVVAAYASRALPRASQRLMQATAAIVGCIALLAFADLVLRTIANGPFWGSARVLPELASYALDRYPPVFDIIHPYRTALTIGTAVALLAALAAAALAKRRTS